MSIVADFLDISGTKAFLRINDTRSARMRLTEQIWNHRLHAGTGKESRWVIFWNQGSGRNDHVPACRKKIEISLSNFS